MAIKHALSSNSDGVLQPQAILEVCLCHHARRTARAITRGFDEALAPLGIKYSQFNILVAIAARESTSAAEVSSLMAMDRTTLSRNLKPLRAAGYLTSEGGAGRRADEVKMTEMGLDLLARAAPLWRQAQINMTQSLGAGQASVLLHSLEAAARAAL